MSQGCIKDDEWELWHITDEHGVEWEILGTPSDFCGGQYAELQDAEGNRTVRRASDLIAAGKSVTEREPEAREVNEGDCIEWSGEKKESPTLRAGDDRALAEAPSSDRRVPEGDVHDMVVFEVTGCTPEEAVQRVLEDKTLLLDALEADTGDFFKPVPPEGMIEVEGEPGIYCFPEHE